MLDYSSKDPSSYPGESDENGVRIPTFIFYKN